MIENIEKIEIIKTIDIIKQDVINTRNKIITLEEAKQLKTIDCILILGAGIRDNSPSPMLKDRLDQGMILYDKKISPKILVSGDHMYHNHDEVNIMKDYLIVCAISRANLC